MKIIQMRKGFEPEVTYSFDPPVFTSCILPSGNGGWQQKSFREGWCLKFENGVGVFQGRPEGEKLLHYFQVIYGSGSSASVKNAG